MPQVFISYRQLDDAQRQRVREFAEKVRSQGVEIILDQFYKDTHPGGPPEGWPKWSSDQAGRVERVLIICTAAWFRCYEGQEAPGTGLGAACEAGVLRQRIYDLGGEQDIIRIAYFDRADVPAIALDLKRYDRFDIERDFEHLIAWIKGEPLAVNVSAEPAPRRLRFWSTRKSIERGEVTVLAIIETVLAVALLITLSVWLDTVRWLAAACALAPLGLLRTSKSILSGLELFAHTRRRVRTLIVLFLVGVSTQVYLVCSILLSTAEAPLIVLAAVASTIWAYFSAIRMIATVKCALLHPFVTIMGLPTNWRQLVVSVDTHTAPVLLPGSRLTVSDLTILGPLMPSKRGTITWLRSINYWPAACVYPPLYLAATAYRWSVKATSLIYLPFVWLANKAQYSPRHSVRYMLHDYLIDDIQRVRRWLAILAVSALTVKVFIWWHLDDVRAWAHEHVPAWGLKIAHEWHHYLDPQNVPWWQITPALNGLIALGMMVYARRVLNLKDHTPSDAVVLRNWRIANVVSGALSIYTIVCVLLLTWKAGDLLGTLNKLWHMLDHKVLP